MTTGSSLLRRKRAGGILKENRRGEKKTAEINEGKGNRKERGKFSFGKEGKKPLGYYKEAPPPEFRKTVAMHLIDQYEEDGGR